MAVEVPQKAEQDAGEHGFGGKAAQVFKGPGDVLGLPENREASKSPLNRASAAMTTPMPAPTAMP